MISITSNNSMVKSCKFWEMSFLEADLPSVVMYSKVPDCRLCNSYSIDIFVARSIKEMKLQAGHPDIAHIRLG